MLQIESSEVSEASHDKNIRIEEKKEKKDLVTQYKYSCTIKEKMVSSFFHFESAIVYSICWGMKYTFPVLKILRFLQLKMQYTLVYISSESDHIIASFLIWLLWSEQFVSHFMPERAREWQFTLFVIYHFSSIKFESKRRSRGHSNDTWDCCHESEQNQLSGFICWVGHLDEAIRFRPNLPSAAILSSFSFPLF